MRAATPNLFDYVIVGAGSAGCVLATRLTENPDVRVLLIEAGQRGRSPYLHIPAGRIRMSLKYDWNYPAEPDPSLNGRVQHWESGKVVGGTSQINGMNWTRGDPREYDVWQSEGAEGWDYASVLPYFKRSETFEKGEDAYRGGNGPLHVSYLRCSHPLVDDFVASAKNAGFRFNPDYNGERIDGVAYGQVSQRRGLRDSTATSFLRSGLKRPNLTLITNATVHRILFRGNRAIGVEYELRKTLKSVYCDQEIALCAGAIGSPKLLMLSGVGPDNDLSEHGINIVCKLPGVGQNLKNHLGILMVFEVDIPALSHELDLGNALKYVTQFLVSGKGPLTSGFGHAEVFGGFRSDQTDYRIIFAPYGRFEPKETGRARDKHKLRISREAAVTLRPGLAHPVAVGSVHLRSALPMDPPRICYEAAASADLAMYTAVGRLCREIMATEPLRRHVLRELLPGPGIETDQNWFEMLRKSADPGKHACSTCRMGADPMSVVDPMLRVHGIEGLRIVDASVMPNITSAGQNAPTIMIAEKAADIIMAST